jgi:hypothetical protein
LDFRDISPKDLQACLVWELNQEASKQADTDLHWILSAPLGPEQLKLPYSELKGAQRESLQGSVKLERELVTHDEAEAYFAIQSSGDDKVVPMAREVA